MKVAPFPSMRLMVEALREASACRSWEKARIASRCAKVALNPNGVAAAYTIKDKAMSRAIELAPERVRVDDGPFMGRVGITFGGRGGLHVPTWRLTPEAAVIVMTKICKTRFAPRAKRREPQCGNGVRHG